MADWTVPASAVVQAVSTVVLVILTAWYASSVRKQVRQDREFFERRAAESARMVERQIQEAARRDRAQVQRAVRTIAAEMELNHQKEEWDFGKAAPLLSAAYAANLWAIAQCGLDPETFRRLGVAYQSVERYNRLYVVASEAQRHETYKISACQDAWRKAQAAIGPLLESLGNDPAVHKLVQDSATASLP